MLLLRAESIIRQSTIVLGAFHPADTADSEMVELRRVRFDVQQRRTVQNVEVGHVEAVAFGLQQLHR